MSYVMRCHGDALGRGIGEGLYLKSFDVDAREGRGTVEWTPDITRALRFADLKELVGEWSRVSTVTPVRPDGRPNKPLTAFNIEPVAVTDEEEP